MEKQEITIYHSPDADDAFMFYGLTSGVVEDPKYHFTHDLADIETLNKRTIAGELDVTAVSVHAFAFLKNQYAILTCGASMGGKDYGPRIVAKNEVSLESAKTIGVPGEHTSASLSLQLALKEKGLTPEIKNFDFKDIFRAVNEGEVDAGVIIHEGQLTFQDEGLEMLLDLGEWWNERTGLPLPLGVNVVSKAIGKEAMVSSATALYKSIDYSLQHREEALDYAMKYARGLARDHADTFVDMYVNDLTLDMGEDGVRSITLFLEEGVKNGIIKEMPELEFISPELQANAPHAANA